LECFYEQQVVLRNHLLLKADAPIAPTIVCIYYVQTSMILMNFKHSSTSILFVLNTQTTNQNKTQVLKMCLLL